MLSQVLYLLVSSHDWQRRSQGRTTTRQIAAVGEQKGWAVGHVSASIQSAITTLVTSRARTVMASTRAAKSSPSATTYGTPRHASMHAAACRLIRVHKASRVPGVLLCGTVVEAIAVAVAAARQSAGVAGSGSGYAVCVTLSSSLDSDCAPTGKY